MRLNWMIEPSMAVSQADVQNACKAFYDKHQVVPDTVKMTYKDYSNFIAQLYQQSIQTLETGKKYGLFVMIPGGMVELLLLDAHDEAIAGGNLTNNYSMMVVESSQIDREFEKHVLDGDK